MPSKSEKQRKFMGADLARAKAGQPTKTGMPISKLKDFARKPVTQSGGHHTAKANVYKHRAHPKGY